MRVYSVLVSLLIVGAVSVFGAPTGTVHVRQIDSSKVFDMTLDPTMSIESIKSKAQENFDAPIDKQSLFLAPNYIPLEDGHIVGDYNVADDATIWVHVQGAQSKLVFIRKIGDNVDKSLKIPFDGSQTIDSIKAAIEESWDIPADELTLYFGPNYVTMEDDQTLADYKVMGDTKATVDSTLWLFVQEDEHQDGVFVRRIDDSTTRSFQFPLGQADSVKTLKTHIQDVLGVPTSDQTLFFGPNHIPMEDDQTLGHYNIVPEQQLKPHSTIWLSVKQQANQNQLFIREIGKSKTLNLPFDESETVRSVKSKIEANWGIPSERQTLYLPPNYIVLDDDQTIGDYKIEGKNQARLESIIWLSISPEK